MKLITPPTGGIDDEVPVAEPREFRQVHGSVDVVRVTYREYQVLSTRLKVKNERSNTLLESLLIWWLRTHDAECEMMSRMKGSHDD